MSYSNLLNAGEILSRQSTYQLYRAADDRIIEIEVLAVVEGTAKYRFIAQAFANLMKSASKDEWGGRGATEDEALRDCLTKIKTVSVDELIQAAKERRTREEGTQK